jgi:GT2 family glycosyltransferase
MDAEVLPGKLTGTFRVKHRIAGDPRVTLCILTPDASGEVPGRGHVNFVSNFVRSIAAKTEYRNYEILIVTDDDLSPETKRALQGIEYRLERYDKPAGPFNYPRKVNFTLSKVDTEHLVLLNDDMEVIAPEWLSALLEFTQQKQIGCAGGRLLFPDGRLQHAGIVLGVNGSAAHVYHSYPADLVGYNGFTHLIRNYSAVTGACLATRRSVVAEVGGFDESFATDFNDVDFCLSVMSRGYRIVYTPHCELYHFENASFRRKSQNSAEVQRFVERWRGVFERDPYYNPNLTRNALDFSAREHVHSASYG